MRIKDILLIVALPIICLATACSTVIETTPTKTQYTEIGLPVMAKTTPTTTQYTKIGLPTMVIETEDSFPNGTPFDQITATPVLDYPGSRIELNRWLLENYFPGFPYGCTRDLLVNSELFFGKLTLTISSTSDDPAHWFWIDEIADNASYTMRAFSACETKNDCFPKLYIEDDDTGQFSLVDWNMRQPNRPIDGLIWMGDDFLCFSQNYNPATTLIAVIDVKKEEFAAAMLVFAQCEHAQ